MQAKHITLKPSREYTRGRIEALEDAVRLTGQIYTVDTIRVLLEREIADAKAKKE